MPDIDIIRLDKDGTVVSVFNPPQRRSHAGQTEADLEEALMKQFQAQGYEYLEIHQNEQLVENLRRQLEKLNESVLLDRAGRSGFSDSEWKALFSQHLANPQKTKLDKVKLIQEDPRITIILDNGNPANIRLFEKVRWQENTLQVIHQYAENSGLARNRYDVTILVNGFPMVHIELKKRSVPIRQAFEQIHRYEKESFWAGSGLFGYVHIFVISDGTETKYFSSTTKPDNKATSFDLTSHWADARNTPILDIEDFTSTFLAANTIRQILAKFCVVTTDGNLLVMRPYQITAVQRILNKILIAENQNWKEAAPKPGQEPVPLGGYVWHATGSGKTLTSFKTAQLASVSSLGIAKVLFVVDRKDLDTQTMQEYNRFEENCVAATNNVSRLDDQLSNRTVKIGSKSVDFAQQRIVVTTIQKLARFLKKFPTHPIYDQPVVIIFDECHRSQFGEMHAAIKKRFKRKCLFGFTGTPIFPENAEYTVDQTPITTPGLFGVQLHAYTLVDSIRDRNTLKFMVDLYDSMKAKQNIKDETVPTIDHRAALEAPERLLSVTRYIFTHYGRKTQGGRYNAILTASSIPMAIRYYETIQAHMDEFSQYMADHPEDFDAAFAKDHKDKKLKVAIIYSQTHLEAKEVIVERGRIEEEDPEGTDGLDEAEKSSLAKAIQDYNATFNCAFDTDGKFQNYYNNVAERMKKRELDLLIVVNMFLTGFDAKCLNTLFCDRLLQTHGLIQAFSRTNRVYDQGKTYGSIVCFLNIQQQIDEAFALFGCSEGQEIALLRSYRDYMDGYTDREGKQYPGYLALAKELTDTYPIGTVMQTDQEKRAFILLFNQILKLQNILESFDAFEAEDPLHGLLQDYKSIYQNLHDEFKSEKQTGKNINDDIQFEMELMARTFINVDYLLQLIAKLRPGSPLNAQDPILYNAILSAINATPEFHSKKKLIEGFMNCVTVQGTPVDEEHWINFVGGYMSRNLDKIIQDEGLQAAPTRTFMERAMKARDMSQFDIKFSEMYRDNVNPFLLPPDQHYEFGEKKEHIRSKLVKFMEMYDGYTL